MKKLFLLITGLIILYSCRQQSKTDNGILKLRTKKLSDAVVDFKFAINNPRKEEFEIEERNDTIFYIKKTYEGIVGKSLRFDTSQIHWISAKIKIDFGSLQYTIDDNPAYPIEFVQQGELVNIEIKKDIIEIPDFYGNTNNRKIFEMFGFKSNEEIVKSIELESFESIKSESLKNQAIFFKTLLEKKDQYEVCCPEYLLQARAFLKSKESDFNSTNELGLELIIKGLTIEIKGQLKNGNKFHKTIIEK